MGALAPEVEAILGSLGCDGCRHKVQIPWALLARAGRVDAPRKPVALGQMSLIVKIFGCRPHANDAARAAGRRTKISKGGNRGKRYGGAFYTEARGPKSG
jgi:hypothetical protein